MHHRTLLTALSPTRHHLRAFTTTAPLHAGRWSQGPAPPRLPKEDQEIFESLQRASTGAFSTPTVDAADPPAAHAAAATTTTNTAGGAPPRTAPADTTQRLHEKVGSASADGPPSLAKLKARLAAVERGDEAEMHPNVRRGAAPEFEGERNPRTGEVGGPKNEPLRWGAAGDWSYNGRVTDF